MKITGKFLQHKKYLLGGFSHLIQKTTWATPFGPITVWTLSIKPILFVEKSCLGQFHLGQVNYSTRALLDGPISFWSI